MKRLLLSLATVSIFGVGAYSFIQASQPQVVQAQDVSSIDENTAFLQDEENTISIVDTYGPSVVAINVSIRGQAVIPEQFQDLLPPGFEMPQGQDGEEAPLQEGAGSGFVVDERGHIVTNYHVVQQALEGETNQLTEGAEITVTFAGSEEKIPVNVLGINPLYDMAMLQLVNSNDLPESAKPIPLADSDELKVGQKVVAIGNPFGLESTVTTGIVSAVNRSFIPSIGGIYVPMVQTDAAINPGNSGGPLLNSKGELVGINTAIIPTVGISGDRGNLGIGFAMPSNALRDNLTDLQESKVIDVTSRPRLGIQAVALQQLFDNAAFERYDLPKNGVAIILVEPSGPGANAGLKAMLENETEKTYDADTGDVITEADGKEIKDMVDLRSVVLAKGAGDVVTLKVWRNGEIRDVEVTLEVVPVTENR